MPKKPKVVMFEDDSMLSDMYKIKFSRSEFEVKVFEYPPKNIVDVIANENPDIISMGVIMPHMDGFQATMLLKKDPRTKDIPLVFLTNLGQADDVKKGLSLGAADYLIKAHLTPDEVVEKYQKILQKHIQPRPGLQKQDKAVVTDKWLVIVSWIFVAIVAVCTLLVIIT